MLTIFQSFVDANLTIKSRKSFSERVVFIETSRKSRNLIIVKKTKIRTPRKVDARTGKLNLASKYKKTATAGKTYNKIPPVPSFRSAI